MADYDPTARPAGGDLSTYQNAQANQQSNQQAANSQRAGGQMHGNENGGSWGGPQSINGSK